MDIRLKYIGFCYNKQLKNDVFLCKKYLVVVSGSFFSCITISNLSNSFLFDSQSLLMLYFHVLFFSRVKLVCLCSVRLNFCAWCFFFSFFIVLVFISFHIYIHIHIVFLILSSVSIQRFFFSFFKKWNRAENFLYAWHMHR